MLGFGGKERVLAQGKGVGGGGVWSDEGRFSKETLEPEEAVFVARQAVTLIGWG